MPLLNDEQTMDAHQIGGTNYGFSAKRLGDLGATEYTLGLLVVDVSGSVASFRDQLPDQARRA